METVLHSAGGFFVIAIALLIFTEVVSRYIFGESHAFVGEYSNWSMVWFTYLLLGAIERARGHITVDILPRRLPPRYKKVLLVVFDVVTLGFAIILLWSGVEVCLQWMQMGATSTSGIPMPLWVSRVCMPLGGVFLAFFAIEHLVKDIPSLGKQAREKE